MAESVRQRVFGLALGYEDLNDHDTLRHDLLWQSAVERDEQLASSPTLRRLENRADRKTAWAIAPVLVEQFIASFREPPQELKDALSMVTTATGVCCRSTFFAESNCS